MADIAPCVAKPCPECPFNRNVKPGALGGSPVGTYLGQILGPFVIACHMHIDFQDPAWCDLTQYAGTPQCAGAAILRANIGVDARMPDALPRAQPDTTRVFADLAEFAVHHDAEMRAVGIDKVRRTLASTRIRDLLVHQQTQRALKGERP